VIGEHSAKIRLACQVFFLFGLALAWPALFMNAYGKVQAQAVREADYRK
jgi:hypothetical protein